MCATDSVGMDEHRADINRRSSTGGNESRLTSVRLVSALVGSFELKGCERCERCNLCEGCDRAIGAKSANAAPLASIAGIAPIAPVALLAPVALVRIPATD